MKPLPALNLTTAAQTPPSEKTNIARSAHESTGKLRYYVRLQNGKVFAVRYKPGKKEIASAIWSTEADLTDGYLIYKWPARQIKQCAVARARIASVINCLIDKSQTKLVTDTAIELIGTYR